MHWIYHHSCWTIDDYCYLQNLFAVEGLHGEGVGRRPIEHIYAKAGAAGCSRMRWPTYESNSDAMELYERITDKSSSPQYRRIL